MQNNEEIPADLLVVRCPGESALLDTTNIDGEQTVKEKFPFEPGYNPEKLQFFHGIIKCSKPNSITD